jgi:hypothetical protein
MLFHPFLAVVQAAEGGSSLVEQAGKLDVLQTLVVALAPIFFAGFALQQLLELLDSWLTNTYKCWNNQSTASKKLRLGLISFFFGLLLAWPGQVRVLHPFHMASTTFPDYSCVVDILITAVFISAGTEGFNSLVKLVGYVKDNANPK